MFNLNHYQYYEEINLGLLKYMPFDKLILDVGCGHGLLGEIYKKNGNTVYGIDSAKEVEKECRRKLDKFYLADITDYPNILKLFKKIKFDVIIFADILEHLPDPVATLLFYYKNFLKKGGLVYFSIPNIAIWYVRLNLLLGRFDYTETGVLDKTHLRFFTKKNLMLLINTVKLKLLTLDITPGLFIVLNPLIRKIFQKKDSEFNRRAILDSSIYKIYAKFIYSLEYFISKLAPGLLAFKFIAIARK